MDIMNNNRKKISQIIIEYVDGQLELANIVLPFDQVVVYKDDGSLEQLDTVLSWGDFPIEEEN